MIEISISSELAAEHPRFMAGCAERGHQIHVFETTEMVSEKYQPVEHSSRIALGPAELAQQIDWPSDSAADGGCGPASAKARESSTNKLAER